MHKPTYHFVIGVIVAAIITISMAELPILEAVVSSVKSTPELRVGAEIGILESTDLNDDLDIAINRRSFAIMLKQVLQMLGNPAGSELSDLKATGIFDPSPAAKEVKRKVALEALAQCTLYLADNGFIKLESKPIGDFVDYRVPAKFRAPIYYLRSNNIVRGYPDGRFGASRNLTRREAVYLLARYYQHISSELMKTRRGDGLYFVDLPIDHPTMASLKLIERAGGFEYYNFGTTFDGNSAFQVKDVLSIIKGILTKQGRETEAEKLDKLFVERALGQGITRSDLAILVGYLAKTFPTATAERTRSFTYLDVNAGTKLADALVALGKYGIFMGYPNGFFKGGEIVTKYEAVGVLGAVLTALQLADPPKNQNLTVAQANFEAYTELMKAKLARIKSINRRTETQNWR